MRDSEQSQTMGYASRKARPQGFRGRGILALATAAFVGLSGLLCHSHYRVRSTSILPGEDKGVVYAAAATYRFTENPEYALGKEDGIFATVKPEEKLIRRTIRLLNDKRMFNGKIPYPDISSHLALEFNNPLKKIEVTYRTPKATKRHPTVFKVTTIHNGLEYKAGLIISDSTSIQKEVFEIDGASKIKFKNRTPAPFEIDSVKRKL